MTAKKPSPKKTAPPLDPRFSQVVDALTNVRGVSYGGKGFGSTALKANDKIFAMMSSKGQFVVKLPKERVGALVGSGKGEYFDAGKGKIMKEWLVVSGKKMDWVELAKEAHAFVKAASA